MQKTNKIGLFALILLTFFCFNVDAKSDDYIMKILKETANKCSQTDNENKALKLKVAEIEKKDKELKSEIDNLKRTAGNTSELLKAERKKFEEEKRTLEQEKKELEEEKRRLAAQNGKNKKEAGEAKDEIREKDSEIETLKGEKQKLQSDLDIAQDKITKLENENKTLKEKTAYCSTPNPLMLIFQILTLLCSICAIVLLIRNTLAIKEFSENNWRN